MATTQNPFDVKDPVKTTLPAGIVGAQIQNSPNTTAQTAQVNTGLFNPNAPTAAQAQATGYGATQAGSQGYDATTRTADQWDVTAPQTVQGQVTGLLQQGNPLLEKALADTRLDAASRGLLNSSMAAGAGRAAVIDKALQIATPDAQTYAGAAQFNATARNQAGSENMGAVNRAAEFGAGAANQAALSNQAATNRAAEFGATAQNAASSQNTAAANALQQSQLDRTLASAQANQAAINQAQSQAAQFQQQTALANQSAAMQAAMANYDGALRAAMADASAANAQGLAQLDAALKGQLAEIEATYKREMQTSQSASTMYAQMMQSISQIMVDKDMDAGAKQNAINQLTGALRGGLEVQQAVASIPGIDAIVNKLAQAPAPAPAPAGRAAWTPREPAREYGA